MRTLIVSDLHLGGVSQSDLLRRGELREPLLEAVRDVDRMVLQARARLVNEVECRDGHPGVTVPSRTSAHE